MPRTTFIFSAIRRPRGGTLPRNGQLGLHGAELDTATSPRRGAGSVVTGPRAQVPLRSTLLSSAAEPKGKSAVTALGFPTPLEDGFSTGHARTYRGA